MKKLLHVVFIVAGILLGGAAFADHDHGHHGGHFGFYFGIPFPYPYYTYPAYYPPVIVTPAPAQAPVYVEQSAPPPPVSQSPSPANYWYHCDRPEGYYPYIKECPGGWKTVSPIPPGQ